LPVSTLWNYFLFNLCYVQTYHLYYADDELPDYIMVMIANKKDVKQMASDLELFLGETAEPFTKW